MQYSQSFIKNNDQLVQLIFQPKIYKNLIRKDIPLVKQEH